MSSRAQSTLLRRRADKDSPALLASSASLRAILNSVGANVFVADLDLQLIYANRFALDTTGKIEPALRSSFGVGVSDLLFGSIHRFHKDPARIERLLRDPRNFPHVATFQFGEVSLATTINAVQDDSDAILGYCVVWEDVSDQRRITETTRAVAAELTDASDQLTALAETLGQQAGSSAERAGTAACAAEQMGAAIQEISSNTAVAATMANDAVTAAGAAATSIAKLNESSDEIGGVVKMITAIAAQTNLLALNATIESARAGDAGKGFAVVANEVKELAKETATATERITRMITGLQDDSAGATSSIDSITSLINRISDGQASIAGAVEEQSATTNEIGRSVTDVARTAETTTGQVHGVSSAASLVAGKAEELRRLVGETS